MANGKIKWFNMKKGYGFIEPENGDKDVFIHISALEKAGIKFLNENQKVSYEVNQTKGKLSAGNIEEIVSDMEKSTKEFLNKAIDAFKNQDIELARKLMLNYKKDISSTSNEIVNSIVSNKNNEFTPDVAGALCLYARYLKRIAAHSRNLISSIVNPFERIGYPE